MDAFERLRARTHAQVALGLSAGGTLALHLAQTRRDDLAGLVLINPFLFSTDRRMKVLPLAKRLLPALPGVGNDIAKPGADEKPYDKTPLHALASLVQLQRRVRARLGEVEVPTLVFTSRQDHVVEPANSALVLSSIASPQRRQVWLERSFHVATLDYDLPDIARLTAEFAAAVCNPGS